MTTKFTQPLSITCLIVIFCTTSSTAQNADVNLLKQINGRETPFKNAFTSTTSHSVNYITATTPLIMLTTGLIKKDKKLRAEAMYFAGGYIILAATTYSLKRIIKRDRPFITYPFIIKRENESSYSFPSGHTASAFYDAVSLSMLYPKWYVITPALLWASSVGYSRMYQGVHYPSDVVAGALTGAGTAWLTYKAKQWVNKRSLLKQRAKQTTF